MKPSAPIHSKKESGVPLPWWRTPLAKNTGWAFLIIISVGLVVWFFAFRPYVSTDDARVAENLIRIAPDGVGGKVLDINVTEGDPVTQGQLLAELDRSQGSDDIEQLMALDTRVHRFVHGCAGNPYLEETLGRYFNLSLRIWYLVLDRLPHLFARVHEHDDLLHAIAAGDAERARASVAEHIETFEREIRSVL